MTTQPSLTTRPDRGLVKLECSRRHSLLGARRAALQRLLVLHDGSPRRCNSGCTWQPSSAARSLLSGRASRDRAPKRTGWPSMLKPWHAACVYTDLMMLSRHTQVENLTNVLGARRAQTRRANAYLSLVGSILEMPVEDITARLKRSALDDRVVSFPAPTTRVA